MTTEHIERIGTFDATRAAKPVLEPVRIAAGALELPRLEELFAPAEAVA